ncbi:MAG: sugar kinase [Saprospiraceae bacterium]|nr:sugar kinase [Saprospiraceae bacterium]
MRGLFIGTTTIDLIYPLKHFPEEDSKTNVSHQLLTLGGPATNAAITFATLGGEATLISPVGEHLWAAQIKEQLASYHVIHFDLTKDPGFIPSISSILVNISSGLRTVITSPTSLAHEEICLPNIKLADYDVCCLDGFHGDTVIEILENKPPSLPVVFDGGSYKYKTDELLKLVDFPIFSERFISAHGMSILEYMQKLNIKTFAITKGANPIEVHEEGKRYELPIGRVKAIDTLAAGDIFHGAFAYNILMAKGDFKAALKQSAEIASLSCQFFGPRAWEKAFKKT